MISSWFGHALFGCALLCFGLARLCLAWLCLAWLGFAWLGIAWLGFVCNTLGKKLQNDKLSNMAWLGFVRVHACIILMCTCVRVHALRVCTWIQFLFASIAVLHSAYWHVLRCGDSIHIAACAANWSAILSDIGNGYMEAIAPPLPVSFTWGNPVKSQIPRFRWHCLPNQQTHSFVWFLPIETSVVGFHHLAPKQHGLKSASFAWQVFTMWKNWSVLSKYDDAGCSNAAGTLHSSLCLRNPSAIHPSWFPTATLFWAFAGRFGKPQGCAHDLRRGVAEAIDQDAQVGDSNKAATNPRFIHNLTVKITMEFVISRAGSDLSNCNTAKPFVRHLTLILPPCFFSGACHNVKYTRFVSAVASFSASLRSSCKRRLMRRWATEIRPRRCAIWRRRSALASFLPRSVDILCAFFRYVFACQRMHRGSFASRFKLTTLSFIESSRGRPICLDKRSFAQTFFSVP